MTAEVFYSLLKLIVFLIIISIFHAIFIGITFLLKKKAFVSRLINLRTILLRLDYCGFGPFCSTGTKLLLSISLFMVLICIIYQ